MVLTNLNFAKVFKVIDFLSIKNFIKHTKKQVLLNENTVNAVLKIMNFFILKNFEETIQV